MDGAISADGNWIVDPVYEKIDWDAVPYEDGTYGRKMIFQCWKNNNQEEIKWDPRDDKQAAFRLPAAINTYSDLRLYCILLPHPASG